MSTTEITSKIENIKTLQTMIDELTAEMEAAKDEVKAEMTSRGVDEMSVSCFKVRYKEVTSSRFDSTAFKKNYSELYEQFCKKTTTAFMVAITILLSLTACGGNGIVTETENKVSKPTTEGISNFLEDLSDAAIAGTANVSDFIYEEFGDGITITRYRGSDTDVVIPAQIDGKPVVEIGISHIDSEGHHIPFDRNITSVVLPDSLISIGALAFADCECITEIKIPDGVVSIGTSAFADCKKLERVIIPDSVKKIDSSAFSSCRNLKSITLPDDLEELALPDNITEIGAMAFRGCGNITNITIPDGVTEIESRAFYECENLINVSTQRL